MIQGQKRWELAAPEPSRVEQLSRSLQVHPAVVRILLNRGLETLEEARAFLNPSLKLLSSPWLMPGMKEAVARIGTALKEGEKVTVYGDYDADGLTATAIMVQALRELGGQADYYLPSRFEDGYGLHCEALEELQKRGSTLVITVDCGINSAREAEYARKLGLDLVITDHHQPLEPAPKAAAVLNPRGGDRSCPCRELAGAGVAFKLASALYEKCGRGLPHHLLDLAALGTVADVVPLLGENRLLVACGLAEINRRPRTGLKALSEAAGLPAGSLSSTGLAFILAPSLNAAGRMGDAEPAVRLLLEERPEIAGKLAEQLRRTNELRRQTEQRILAEAVEEVESDRRAVGETVITLARAGWHRGVIGIVAARLVERYFRPAVVIALEGETGCGSARSIPAYNITEALSGCAGLLERFGGHAQAAGLTLPAERVTALRQYLDRHAAGLLAGRDLVPVLKLEGELDYSDISLDLAQQLEALAPFGTDNPQPVFCSRSWELKSWSLVGSAKKHLKFNLKKGGTIIRPILFSGSALADRLQRGRSVDLAFSLSNGLYRDRPVLNVEILDIRYNDCASFQNVTVVDRREKEARLDYLRELARSGQSPLAVFAGTGNRCSELMRKVSGRRTMFYITSGNGGNFAGQEPCTELVLYDLPLHPSLLEPFFKQCPPGGPVTVHMLFHRRDRRINQSLIRLALPTREDLAEVYRALQETAAAGEPVSFPGRAVERLPVKPGDTFWRRCRDILEEIGLIKAGLPDRIKLKESVFPDADGFNRSAAYGAARQLEAESERFQEMLLNDNPESLAAYWHNCLKVAGGSG